jgi:deazaflavin-dependent oxidoreductase (nitroreductase family)
MTDSGISDFSIGARSGEQRVSPMMYLPDGDRYLVFASAAGADRYPAWYWNLRAQAEASIEVGDDHLDVRAVELEGAERDEKYAEQAKRYPDSRITNARRAAPSRCSRWFPRDGTAIDAAPAPLGWRPGGAG